MIKEYPKDSEEQISEHFKASEFKCKCSRENCDHTLIDTDLVAYLEKKRASFCQPIKIMSGFRCTAHNKEVGGKKGSIHMLGKAADIQVEDWKPEQVAVWCEDADGMGRYPTFVHVDVRGYKARWKG